MELSEIQAIAEVVLRQHDPQSWPARLADKTLLLVELEAARRSMQAAEGADPRTQRRAAVRLGKALLALEEARLPVGGSGGSGR